MNRREAFLHACFREGESYDGIFIRQKIRIAFEKVPCQLIKFLDHFEGRAYFKQLGTLSVYSCDEVQRRLMMNEIEFTEKEEEALYSHIEKCQKCVDWLLETGDMKLDFLQFTQPKVQTKKE